MKETLNDKILNRDNFNGFNIAPISKKIIDQISSVYIPLFESHPWHEEFECSCGAGPFYGRCEESTNSGECSELDSKYLIDFKQKDQKCPNCEEELTETISQIFTPESVKQDFYKALKSKGFKGFAATKFNKVISFFSGHNFLLDHPEKTGSVWYKETGDLLKEKGVNPENCFYHEESGTLERYSGKDLGTFLLTKTLLTVLNDNSIDKVAFRTINPAIVRCYEKAFELDRDSLKPLFKDPNPDKRQEWYSLCLHRLLSINEPAPYELGIH